MIDANINRKQVEKLLEVLYEERRFLAASGVDNPHFVFLIPKASRHEIEARFLNFCCVKMGMPPPVAETVVYGGESSHASYFHFGGNGSIVLLEQEAIA